MHAFQVYAHNIRVFPQLDRKEEQEPPWHSIWKPHVWEWDHHSTASYWGICWLRIFNSRVIVSSTRDFQIETHWMQLFRCWNFFCYYIDKPLMLIIPISSTLRCMKKLEYCFLDSVGNLLQRPPPPICPKTTHRDWK